MSDGLTKTLTGTSGGLGRPPRAAAKRASRPRFVSVDVIWLLSAFLVTVIASELTNGSNALSEWATYLAGAAAATTYWLGWYARDRVTGVVASSLIACSPSFAAAAAHQPASVICVLFLAASIAANIAQLLIPSVCLAALATVASPDGVLLGAILLAFAFNDKHPRAFTSFLLYFLIVVTGWMAVIASGTRPMVAPQLHPNLTMIRLFLTGSAASWCFWPFLADLAEPTRRQRWRIVVLWAVLYMGFESLVVTESLASRLIVAMPFFALMQGGGVARLIPVIASDFMSPRSRYVIATASIVFLVVQKAVVEWPHAQTVATRAGVVGHGPERHSGATAAVHPAEQVVTPHPISAPHPAAAIVPAAPAVVHTASVADASAPQSAIAVPPIIPHHVVVVPVAASPAPGPGVTPQILAEAQQYGVPTTTVVAGHVRGRTRWAIVWNINAAKAAARKAAALKAHAMAAAAAAPVKAVAKPVETAQVRPAKPATIKAVHPTPVKPAKAIAVRPATPRIAIVKPAPVPVPAVSSALLADAKKYGIPTTHVVAGHVYPRTRWAIQWSINEAKAAALRGQPATPAHAAPIQAVVSKPATTVRRVVHRPRRAALRRARVRRPAAIHAIAPVKVAPAKPVAPTKPAATFKSEEN